MVLLLRSDGLIDKSACAAMSGNSLQEACTQQEYDKPSGSRGHVLQPAVIALIVVSFGLHLPRQFA